MLDEEQSVPAHATTRWDRHAILAEIRRRFGSSRALAEKANLTPSEISAALGSPYPKAEKAIAKALDMPVQTLWPDRYWPNGRQRRSGHSRTGRAPASQKRVVPPDQEDGQ